MDYIYSRRTYDASAKTFGVNVATHTRYLQFERQSSSKSVRTEISAESWARGVFGQAQTGEVLIYVHGYRNSQKDVRARLDLIQKGVAKQGFKGAVVAFDWPSNGEKSQYRTDQKKAHAVAPHFVLDGVKLLLDVKPSARIHVIAHSMGAYLATTGLGVVGDPPAPMSMTGKLSQMLFVAADVDRNELMPGTRNAMTLQKRCERVTNYYSSEDRALHASGQSVNWFTKRSGHAGLSPALPNGFQDVSCTDRYFVAVPKQSDRWDAKTHNWYFDDSRFYADIVATMSGTAAKAMQTRQPHTEGDQRILPT